MGLRSISPRQPHRSQGFESNDPETSGGPKMIHTCFIGGPKGSGGDLYSSLRGGGVVVGHGPCGGAKGFARIETQHGLTRPDLATFRIPASSPAPSEVTHSSLCTFHPVLWLLERRRYGVGVALLRISEEVSNAAEPLRSDESFCQFMLWHIQEM